MIIAKKNARALGVMLTIGVSWALLTIRVGFELGVGYVEDTTVDGDTLTQQ